MAKIDILKLDKKLEKVSKIQTKPYKKANKLYKLEKHITKSQNLELLYKLASEYNKIDDYISVWFCERKYINNIKNNEDNNPIYSYNFVKKLNQDDFLREHVQIILDSSNKLNDYEFKEVYTNMFDELINQNPSKFSKNLREYYDKTRDKEFILEMRNRVIEKGASEAKHFFAVFTDESITKINEEKLKSEENILQDSENIIEKDDDILKEKAINMLESDEILDSEELRNNFVGIINKMLKKHEFSSSGITLYLKKYYDITGDKELISKIEEEMFKVGEPMDVCLLASHLATSTNREKCSEFILQSKDPKACYYFANNLKEYIDITPFEEVILNSGNQEWMDKFEKNVKITNKKINRAKRTTKEVIEDIAEEERILIK